MKCHLCFNTLIPGKIYDFECECGWCRISFNENNIPNAYILWLHDDRSFVLLKYRNENTQLYCTVGKKRIISEMNVDLKIKDDIPQAYSLFEKMKKLAIFQ